MLPFMQSTSGGTPTPPPPPSAVILTGIAGENIAAFKALVNISGLIYLADVTTLAHAGHVVGISTAAALMGASVSFQQVGQLDNPSFGFTPWTMVFVGTSGALVQPFPTGGGVVFEQPMGLALSATRLEVAIDLGLVF